MPIGAPKSFTSCKRFFTDPASSRQRQYEAFRAYFVEGRPSAEVARAFGYTPGSFQVMCHHFRREREPVFFVSPRPGPRTQPKKAAARDRAVELRKRNLSVYEISETLKQEQLALSPTAVRELLKAEGFSPLPRRLDEERPDRPRPSIEAVADVRSLSLAPRRFTTQHGGLFLFLPELVRLGLDGIARDIGLPGSKMIPAACALRSMLALKLTSIDRTSHIMPQVTDEGLALFAGLNVIPKKSFLSEYSSRVGHHKTTRLLAAIQDPARHGNAFPGRSFNLDFHSIPYYGDDSVVERHYVSMRSRRQQSILTFLAQDADGDAFCYSNADLRKGEEADEIFRFIEFWQKTHRLLPRHLVFDSKLTTYKNLVRLDDMGITFITLRRRSPSLRKEIALLPRSAWRTVELDVPTRKYKTPRVFDQTVTIDKRAFRQLFIEDLGHEEATILLTNDRPLSAAKLITRYAQRMLIENALSDAVRFFHRDALSSTVGLKVDFDMALLVLASSLYRHLARTMRGYADAQARKLHSDLLDLPATIEITAAGVEVHLHRRAHLPIVISSGLLDKPVAVPWWNDLPLRLSA
jgi:transposase